MKKLLFVIGSGLVLSEAGYYLYRKGYKNGVIDCGKRAVDIVDEVCPGAKEAAMIKMKEEGRYDGVMKKFFE